MHALIFDQEAESLAGFAFSPPGSMGAPGSFLLFAGAARESISWEEGQELRNFLNEYVGDTEHLGEEAEEALDTLRAIFSPSNIESCDDLVSAVQELKAERDELRAKLAEHATPADLPGAEELAKLLNEEIRKISRAYEQWENLQIRHRDDSIAAMQAVLDHLAPWLRAPVAYELGVTLSEACVAYASAPIDAGAARLSEVLDLCRSRIKPVYTKKENS